MKTFYCLRTYGIDKTETYHNRQKVVSRSIAFVKRLPKN